MEFAHDLPLRQITRLRTEMGISAAEWTGRLFPDQPMLGVEFAIAARVSLPDWAAHGTLARPDAPTRAITVRRMALSLGSPAETTRRHVRQLVERGVLASTAAGVALAATPESEALALHYYRTIHDLFVRLIEDMVATCDLDLPVGGQAIADVGDVVLRALDILLLPIDAARPLRSRMAFLLWGALTAAAVRPITYDPVLARRYASEIPPDALRAGVSLRRVATLLSIPYATAWRQLATLQEEELVTRVGERWTVTTRNLLAPTVREVAAGPSVVAYRKTRELTLMGLDPARARALYLGDRPPLVDFGRHSTVIRSGAEADCDDAPEPASTLDAR